MKPLPIPFYFFFHKEQEGPDQISWKFPFLAPFLFFDQNPEMTRTRMYYEMITKTLPGVKLYIDVSDTATEKLLPLDEFAGVN